MILLLRLVPYQVDDAYITYRYAANAVDGHWLRFNPYGPMVEGFTSPLWFLGLVGIATLFGAGEIPAYGTWMGFLAYGFLFLVILGIFWSSKSSRENTERSGWSIAFASGLLLLFPGVQHYAVAGLETVLFLLVVVVYTGAVARRLPLPLGVLAGLLATWVRPEGGWLPVTLFLQLLMEGRIRESLGKRSLWLIGSVGSSLIVLVSIRYLIFQDFVPNTFHAKIPSLVAGINYLVANLSTLHGFMLFGLGVLGGMWGDGVHRGFLGAAIAWMIAVLIEGGDWMLESRMMLPAFANLALAATGTFRRVESEFAGLPSRKRGKFYLLVLLVCLAAATVFNLRTNLNWIEQSELYNATKRKEAMFVADWIVRSGARSAGLVDIGEIGLVTRVDIFDLGGLTDPRIGRAPGGHLSKDFDRDYLFEDHRPDVLLLRTNKQPEFVDGRPLYHAVDLMSEVERHVATDRRFENMYELEFAIQPSYHRVPSHYGLLLYKRRSFDPRFAAKLMYPADYFDESRTIYSPKPLL